MKFNRSPPSGIHFHTCKQTEGHEEGSSFFSRITSMSLKPVFFCFRCTNVKYGNLTPEKEIPKNADEITSKRIYRQRGGTYVKKKHGGLCL